MTTAVTATAGGTTSNGICLQVFVLTGAAAAQNGATWIQSANAAHNATASTTVAGSRVYGGVMNGAAAAPTVFSASTTLANSAADAGHTKDYGTWKQTAATVTPGSLQLGFTDSNNGGIAGIEILPAVTGTAPAEDGSAPAFASTLTAVTIASAGFTPPTGALLVACIASNGATSAVITMTVTDTWGLAWTAAAQANVSNMKYAGVFLAVVRPAVFLAQVPWAGPLTSAFGPAEPFAPFPQPYGDIVTASVPVSDSDTGTFTDALVSVSPRDSDTATGTEGTPSTGITSAETGTGTEGAPSAGLSGTDTGSGADALVSVSPQGSDTAAGADAGESLGLAGSDTAAAADGGTIGIAQADTGSAAEGTPSAGITDSDTGTSAETAAGIGVLSQAEVPAPPPWLSPLASRFGPAEPFGIVTGQPAPSGLTPVSDSDTGTFTDAGESLSLAGSDTAAAADGGTIGLSSSDASSAAEGTPSAGITSADSATAAEGTPSAGITQSDTGTGSDALIAVGPQGTDTGSGADAFSGSLGILPAGDTATGTEGTPSAGLSSSDSATGTEGTPSAGIASADTGLGTDALVAAGPKDSDSATATESTPVTVSLSSADIATGTDAGETVKVTDSDTGSATAELVTGLATGGLPAPQQPSQWQGPLAAVFGPADPFALLQPLPQGPPSTPTTLISDSDAGTFAEGTPSITASLSSSDAGTFAEGTPSAGFTAAGDTATGTEGTPSAGITQSDAATGSDALTAVGPKGTDTGTGTEGTPGTGIASAETATGTEGTPSAGITQSDASTGTEGTPGTGIASADTATGSDVTGALSATAGDSGAFAESTPSIVLPPAADAGTGSELGVIGITSLDVFALTAESQNVTVLTGTIHVTSSDAGTFADGQGFPLDIAVIVTSADVSVAVEPAPVTGIAAPSRA